MRVRGGTWAFFAGYSPEYDHWSIRFDWGKSKERLVNGLFYKKSIVLWFRWPRRLWRYVNPRAGYWFR